MDESILKELIEKSGGDYEIFASHLAIEHPVRLGLVLLELYAVRSNRYGAHPDFFNPLAKCWELEKKPTQDVARINKKEAGKIVNNFKNYYKKLRKKRLIGSAR